METLLRIFCVHTCTFLGFMINPLSCVARRAEPLVGEAASRFDVKDIPSSTLLFGPMCMQFHHTAYWARDTRRYITVSSARIRGLGSTVTHNLQVCSSSWLKQTKTRVEDDIDVSSNWRVSSATHEPQASSSLFVSGPGDCRRRFRRIFDCESESTLRNR